MISKERIRTLCVISLVVVAGCSALPISGDENPRSDDTPIGPNHVTYSNETETRTITVVVTPENETYEFRSNATLESPDGATVDHRLAVLCEALEESTYNATDANATEITNATYIKTTGSGETETVQGLPDRLFTDYQPRTVRATIAARNGTELARCTVNGRDDFTFAT